MLVAATGRWRIGTDVGGTFTDLLCTNDLTGQMWVVKVPATPRDPAMGIISAVGKLSGVSGAEVACFNNATTVATNAILEGKTARIGLITTKGFRDVLEVGRQIRPSKYGFRQHKPPMLLSRENIAEVEERIDFQGNIITELDEAGVRDAARVLRNRGVEGIGIVFLFSFLNPAHERRSRELVLEDCPDLDIALSSDVYPEFREYERTSTTAVNIALRRVIEAYVTGLGTRLRDDGIDVSPRIMRNDGGVMTGETATSLSQYTLGSGPAAGVIGGSVVAGLAGFKKIITMDMGGTSVDVALVENGVPMMSDALEICGIPIKTRSVDFRSIGTGGGSIAWIDAGDVLRVGPESAGAEPGPACYGKGGVRPTVTDANLVLGLLNPDYFLGGEIPLSVEKARHAVGTIAEGLDMDLVTAAESIVRISDSNTEGAIRLVSTDRGRNPADYALVAFGGAGPGHAGRIAEMLGIPVVLVPRAPGVTSALGVLSTAVRYDCSRTFMAAASQVNPPVLEGIYRQLEREGLAKLEADGIPVGERRLQRSADMRYIGQSYELNVPAASTIRERADVESLIEGFYAEHLRTYTHRALMPTEFVTLRVAALGPLQEVTLKPCSKKSPNSEQAVKGRRSVYFSKYRSFVMCPVYERAKLSPGKVLTGPAIVEEPESTTVVYPDQRATIDEYSNILIEVRPASLAVGSGDRRCSNYA
jgi:N-methylhydantoinase A